MSTSIKLNKLTYHISEIASVIKGTMVAFHDDAEIRELLMDSRKAVFPEYSLFFALKGARRNGHAFIGEAHKKGIRNFVVSEKPGEELEGANIILVKDVLSSMQALAMYHRSRFHIPVIGITGSNGKTVVKEWLNQLLNDRYNIIRSPKSYNSQIGVPISVWQLNEAATLGIFEAGISQSNEMDNLQKIIQPDIGVFTNIGDAHSGGFLNNRQKIREKLRLFTKVKTLIYCRDFSELNEAVASMYQQLKTGPEKPFEILSWSTITDAELHITNITRDNTSSSYPCKYFLSLEPVDL